MKRIETEESAAEVVAQHDRLEGAELRAAFLDAVGWTPTELRYWRNKVAEKKAAAARPSEPLSPPRPAAPGPTGRTVGPSQPRRRAATVRPPHTPGVAKARTKRTRSIVIIVIRVE
ncbi:hypothetical protein GA0115240_144851 [Streptomyces sp. DvalAA-14]|uniref:hypothetical protein n=1 Tax=unclassified Streptomyces TaxID=2593676 RepID=UPI00081B357A|nr:MULTISPECIES: hypothetical protein [unclassified Streptomyces]MYS22799.1 hypothetical protein [Streptomyces sp. SID4948]SCE22577.1 hypothetical protein GA0115240_144851 [Streptomyces sp. DvalAA-14]